MNFADFKEHRRLWLLWEIENAARETRDAKREAELHAERAQEWQQTLDRKQAQLKQLDATP